jgi:hypothetical protein
LARLTDAGSPREAQTAKVLKAEGGHVNQHIKAGPDDRLVVVSTESGDGFEARLDGKNLSSTGVRVGTAFSVGGDGGKLEVNPGGHRLLWLLAQALCIVVAVVFASPSIERRQTTGEEDA